ncbi:helix-turn-helix transcriptional regulator [Candidatus Micrarchaeota archaeon]|nr:helix-turn-helix transcriptional regulator [Candidatus Micrarchaeota archaeon]
MRSSGELGRFIAFLRKYSRPKFGPAPAFDSLDLVRAFWTVCKRQPISRQELSSTLELGEGSVRSAIRALASAGLVEVRKRGCIPARRGRALFGQLACVVSRVSPVRASAITFGERAVGAVVAGGASKVRMGLEERDAALRAGASGATVLVRKGKLHLTGSFDDRNFITPDVEKEIESVLSPCEGDAVILSYSPRKPGAERGAWGAVLALMEGM